MKTKLVLLMTMVILILFTFAGCRKLGSTSSTVSGVVSALESDGKLLQSQVSGVVSDVNSAVTASK